MMKTNKPEKFILSSHRILRISFFLLLALCLMVVSQIGAVSVSDQKGPDSVVTGQAPFVDTWSGMMARDQHKLAQRFATPQVEEAPLRIPEDQPRFSPESALVPSAPSGKTESQSEAPQAISTSFQTISLQDQFNAFGSGSIPPDTMGAVGPNHFMEVINSSVAVYNKSGTRLSLVSLDSFFTASFSGTTYPRNGSFDPRVLYDRRSGRWFAIALEFGNPAQTQNHVILAVSASSDPTGSWYKYLVQVGVPSGTYTYFSDYDTLGTDDNGVYVAVRIFPSTGGGSSYAKIAAMQKTPLLSGTASTVSFFTGISDMYSTPQPAHNLDPIGGGDRAWFVSSSSTVYGNVNYRRLTWSGGTPSLDASSSVLTTPAYGGPLNAPASGSATSINVGDDRLQMAVIRGTNLWTCRNVGLDSAGGSGTSTRTGCEWLQLSLTSGSATLVQSGRVYDSAASNPRYYYYPSIMVSGQGHAAMGFSGSSSTEYVGVYFTGRLNGDTSGTMGSIVLIKAGEASYQRLDGSSRNRWGDYSYTSLDPNDDMSFWTIQEYASSIGVNIWGTWAARLLAPPPTTPSGCSPASVVQGTSSADIVVLGTSTSGSGFFDPGAGFSNRLAVVVNGGGVTVNSVTYSNSTNITINVTVSAGATTGARTVTVTNPDGQATTSASGILTITASPPTITQQPSSTNVCAGAAAVFAVAATGTGLTYQWQTNSVSLINNGYYSGVTTSNLTVSAADSSVAGSYSCVVSNTGGSVTSSNATLVVNTAPSVSSSPTNLTVCAGALANFSVAATGSPAPSVQWQASFDGGGNWTNLNGATTLTNSFSAGIGDNGHQYRAVFSNACGTTNSVAATLTVQAGLLGVSPVEWNFGAVATGTTVQTNFVVTNAGCGTLSVTATSAAPFAVVTGSSAFTLPGFGATNVMVSFTPPAEGWFTNRVVFTSDGGVSTNQVIGQGAVAPAALFSASPTNGVAPLKVIFTDTSTGTITNRFWDFGNGTINTTATSVTNTYAAGTYSVTLIASGPLGANTNTHVNLITVLNPFQAWQLQYFACTNCPQAAAGADPYGTGQNNLFKYVAGLDPTNPVSVFVLSIASVPDQPNQKALAWKPWAGGRTYTLLYCTNLLTGVYTNLTSYSGPTTNSTEVTVTDLNAVEESKFYRIQITYP